MSSDEGPIFATAPPGRIELPSGLALVRADPELAAAAARAINASLDHLRPWMAWAAEPATEATLTTFLAGSAERWDKRQEFGYSIVDPSDDAVVGGCGLHGRLGPNGLEIGYWVHADRTGQGIATMAAAALTDAAFAIEGIEVVRIQCEVSNHASARVPERLGYRCVGHGQLGEGPCEGRPTQVWLVDRASWLTRQA